MGHFERELQERLPAWVEDGILEPAQAERLRARHPVQDDRGGRTVRVLVTLGAVLVGVGLVLAVATNWRHMGQAVQVVLLLTVAATAYVGGWFLDQRRHARATGQALYLVGGAAFGGTIFLVANIYHLPADNPWLILAWMAGVFPPAYALRSVPLAVLGVALVPFWIMFQFMFDLDDGHLAWGALLFLAAGWIMMALAAAHPAKPGGRLPPFRLPYQVAGLLLATIPVFVLTFPDRLPHLFETYSGRPYTPPVEDLVFILAGLVAAVALALRTARREGPMGVAPLGILVGTGLIAVVFAEPVLVNLVYPAALIGLMLLAVQVRDEMLFTIMIALFVAEVFGRYVEFIADMGNASVAFIIGGLLLLGVGYGAERLRRHGRRRIHEVAHA